MTREFEGLEEGQKSGKQFDLLKITLKKIKLKNARPWWNTWFLIQEIYLHSRLTSTRNEQMPTRSTRTRMDDQRKGNIDPKGPNQRNYPKQLQTHYLPTNDVENINKTNKEREIYNSLISRGLFPEEQKGCRNWYRGTEELPYIDQHILNESKTTRKNLAMAWIDYKKAYDMSPQSWMINCLKMYKISD